MRSHPSFSVVALVLAAYTSGCGDGGEKDDSQSTGGSSPQGTTSGTTTNGGATGNATNPGTGSGQGGSTTVAGTAGNAGNAQGGNSVVTTTGGSSNSTLAAVDCTDTATAATTLSARYDAVNIPVTGKDKSYHAATNWWHKYTAQTVDIHGLGFVVGNSDNLSSAATDGAPIGYPTLYIGTYSGTAAAGSNLPKQVSALTSVPTIFDTNATSLDTSNINAAYDVWFTSTGTPLPETQYNPGKGGAYLMVWLFDPSGRQPRGKNQFPAHTVPGVPGAWDVWIDASDPPCISYVSTTPMSSLAFDLNGFIQDSVDNSYGVTASMYLSVVFAGFEIWGGGDGLELKQFCADVK